VKGRRIGATPTHKRSTAMTTVAEPQFNASYSEQYQYKVLSSAAVASMAAGVLSALALLDWRLGLIPAMGILLGALALFRIRANPTEITGQKLAIAGIALSTVLWATGAARLTYVYLTEVPDGYQRIAYSQLQPDPNVPGQTVPPSAQQLDGQRVFIKGFAYPGSQQTGIREFVLCRDQGTCCFGGATPKLTDMVQVKLKDPLRLDYSTRMLGLAGTFRVERGQASDDLGKVLYHLEADYLK
jgi:hypothetical protein